jgi:hypothetical protein
MALGGHVARWLRDRKFARLFANFRYAGAVNLVTSAERRAAERCRVQFRFRRDGNLAVIDSGRGLPAQRDSVIADDVDAHGWVLLNDPAAAAAGDPH